MQDFDSLLILTDLEPDDIIACYIQLTHTPANTPILFVTGEGNKNKGGLAKCFIDSLLPNLKHIEIIHGDLSKSEYPEEILSSFGKSDNINILKDTGQIKHFLEIHNNPFILCLKPPRELYDIPSETLNKCTMAIYGSFNFRTMFNTINKDAISELINTRFKHVYLYESFLATGINNSINTTNAESLYNKITDSKWDGLHKMVYIWNKHMIINTCKHIQTTSGQITNTMTKYDNINHDMLSTIKNLANIMHRNQKILDNIISDPKQMVLADFGLTACLYSPLLNDDKYKTRGTISFNDFGYTCHITEDDVNANKVTLYHDIPFEIMIEEITKLL
jgi:hypothetical protein